MAENENVRSANRPEPGMPGRAGIPLYEKVAAMLRAEIATRYQPGDKMESGPKLAQRLGVSVLTIREAVSALAQEGLLERSRGSGTYIRRVAMQPVAVLIGLSPDELRHSYFFLHLVHQLEARLQAAGIPCRQYFAHPGGERSLGPIANSMFLEDVDQGRLSAVIPVSLTLEPGFRKVLKSRRIHMVDLSSIQTDYCGMVDAAVGWLVANGRRHIALFGYPTEAVRERFIADLQAAGIKPEPEWIRNCQIGAPAHESAATALNALWATRARKPDGLICLHDVILDQAAPMLLHLGVKVPGELMVAAHANRNSGIRYPFPVARMELDPDTYATILAAMVAPIQRSRPPAPPSAMVQHRWVPESPADTAAQGDPAASHSASETRSLASQ